MLQFLSSTPKPDSRPLSAVFSFRDNALTSHREAKTLIEYQTGIKIKYLQFDPVCIRERKEHIKSRWIMDLYSDWDLHTVLEKGLIAGKDKLFFYRYNDIKVSGNEPIKYFEKLPEAKPKLHHRGKHSARPGLKRLDSDHGL